MGSLYLPSIMKVQTAIFCFLVVACLCVSHISAKNIHDVNEIEIEKSQAEAVLKRNARSPFMGFGSDEEEPDFYGDDDEEDSNREEEEDDRRGNGNGRGNGKKVDWIDLIVGIVTLIKSNFF